MTDLAALSPDDLELVAAAEAAIAAARDGAVRSVGAAVRSADGSVHVGVNLYHFTGGPCAELVALATARTRGATSIATIVAVGDRGRGVLSPCGRDRQVFVDLYPGLRVIVPTPDGPRSIPATSLLPHAYSATTAQRQRLEFAPDYLDAVRAGTKRATIRRNDSFRLGPADLVFDADAGVVLTGEVTSLVQKRLGEVTLEEARIAGNTDLDHLAARLSRHYPGVTAEDVVTIVGFRLTEPG